MSLTTPRSQSWLILISTMFLMVFTNITFFKGVLAVYPLSIQNTPFLISLFILFSAFTAIILSLFCYRLTIKPVLMTIMVVSSFTAYFMDSYATIIDATMIENIIQTNFKESLDLFSMKLVAYVFFLGLLPAFFIYKLPIKKSGFKESVIERIKLFAALGLISASIIWLFSNYYFSFFREHRALRHYVNPGYYMTSVGKFIRKSLQATNAPLKKIALDAKISPTDKNRELVLFVVGETVRADHFSLNGYKKETNPLLKKENVINFTNVSSCGTSTAHSVPCMFSVLNRDNYDKNKAQQTENVLDILKRAGVNILWLDNNSSSKGVADRVNFIDYRTTKNNPACDIECRDEGMLMHLQEYIDAHPEGDILIIMHQMGNHGPAYYKRYPVAFEKFTPVCKTNQFEACTREEISNAYDNAILYTDYFLSKAIQLLKKNNDGFETALFYASDHGESLGENGIYLHGLPYMLAPDAQKKVPLLLWFSEDSFNDRNDVSLDQIRNKTNSPISHDNIFHTLLGLFEVTTDVYEQRLDITKLTNDQNSDTRYRLIQSN